MRHQEMSFWYRRAVGKDHGHRLFQYRKSDGTEKYQCCQQDSANSDRVFEKRGYVGKYGPGLARRDPFQIAAEPPQQRGLINQMGKGNDRNDNQWTCRQQRVIGDGPPAEDPGSC
jgi:hypothetical protein